MYPHERSLVEKMEGKLFALLGVNTDDDRAEIKQVIQTEKINWRSWWDGSGGRIVNQWGVKAFPTIYLIDHKGIIRHQNLRGKALDEAIEKLVREAEGDKAL
jgi:ribosomal protein S1